MYDGKNLPCIKEEAQTIRKRGQLSLWCYYGKENRQNYFIKIPQWIFFTLLQMYKKNTNTYKYLVQYKIHR